MRVAVGALVVVHVVGTNAEVVVLIVRVGGRQAAQKGDQVLEQQRLGFLDSDGGGRMARDDGDDAIPYTAVADAGSDIIGDVQELDRLGRLLHQPSHVDGGGGAAAAQELHLA